MKAKIGIFMLCVAAVTAFLLTVDSGWSAQKYDYGIVIKVKPGIIKFPANVDRFPLQRARVRSTELRELNKQYEGAEIERVYNVVKVGNKSEEKVPVEDTYIIWFADEFIDMEQALNDYSELDIVLSVSEK